MTATITEPKRAVLGKRLQTPRAAAVAGILFALLYGTGIALIRLVIPEGADSDSATWMANDAGNVKLALNLVPYAGIAFLWFIGVIRDRLGELEDRFFSTVFLGSGLLFLALTFTGAALAGGLLSSYAITPETIVDSGVLAYGRAVMYQVINIYAIRMAGVFMISLSTIWLRTGLMHRGWAFVTYALALVLLASIGLSLWVILIFPTWVMAVSVFYLVVSMRQKPKEATGETVSAG